MVTIGHAYCNGSYEVKDRGFLGDYVKVDVA